MNKPTKKWDWCLDEMLRRELEAAWKAYQDSCREYDLYRYLQIVESVPDECIAVQWF
jgi:hypothetical protein